MTNAGDRWREAFANAVRQREVAEPLKKAALSGRLQEMDNAAHRRGRRVVSEHWLDSGCEGTRAR